MSRSSLWTMDKEYFGFEGEEFSNSWLFSPIAWNVLFEKYLPDEVMGSFGKQSFLSASMFDSSVFTQLNSKINASSIEEDRILWELCNQQVFFTKDKELVANTVKNFLTNNTVFTAELEDHIHERFQEVAEAILALDEESTPYFIFKNTSVDDEVEYWFYGYDEEEEERFNRSLKDVQKHVTEFVVFEEGKVQRFVPNRDYFFLASE